MTRNALRWVYLSLFTLAVPAFAQVSRPGSDEPNQETLKRLAQQLGTGSSQMPDIDPELMKLAAEYLKNNPDLMKDPAFQKQVQQYQQQAKQDPEGFAKNLKQQNPGLTQKQIDDLKQQFQKSNPGGFQPPPNFPQPTKPPVVGPGQPPPDPTKPGQFPTQPQPQPQPGQPQPGQPQPQPGQQNPWQPNGQPTPSQSGQGQGQTAAQKAQGKEEYQQVVGMWESTFGDIEKTPALKQSLVDMFSGDGKSPWGDNNGNGKPWDGKNGNGTGKSPFDNGNGSNSGSQNGFVNWLKSTTSGPPSWWKNMTGGNNSSSPPPKMGGGSGFNPPSPSYGGGGGGLSIAGLSGAGLTAVILIGVVVLAVAAFLICRYWPQIQAKLLNKPKPVAGLGPWTIDPRDVKDRETLVKAFEYLSVLICGDGARVWNHQTIADAFRENVAGAAPFADPLARLYALARYSPTNEPIDQADIAEARGYLCRLAGV